MDESTHIGESAGRRRAVCLWCGTGRPVEIEICPTCNHGWIDATVGETTAGRLDALPSPTPAAVRHRRWWRRRWIPLVAAGAAALIYVMIFSTIWQGSGGAERVAAATVASSSPPLATDPGPEADAAATAPATTATTSTTTTSSTTTTLPLIAAVEPPIAIDDLALGAFTLGPLELGEAGSEPVGRLVATLGQPDERFEVGENWGLCPDDTARVLTWGHLSVILRQEGDIEVLVGYRLSEEFAGLTPAETKGLTTISGTGIGDTFSDVQAAYSSSIVTTVTLDDDTPVFLILRSSDRRTLVWGPLSSAADPEVRGVYSPRPCDGGPFAG